MRLVVANLLTTLVLSLAGCQNAQPYQEYEETEDAFGAKTYRWSSGYRGTFKGSGPLDGYTPPESRENTVE